MADKFCSNCGAALAGDANFCRNCGARISSDPAPSPETNAPSAALHLAIPANYKKGLVVLKNCTLVFADSEMIAAMTDRKMMNDHITSIRNEAKGQGFMQKTAAVMQAGYSFSDRYYNMSLDRIKNEAPGSFWIPYNTVQSVRYKRSTTNYGYDNTTTTTTPASLTMKTTGGKFVFSFTTEYRSRELISLLNNIFTGRYKGPKR